jgi:hypothetical protein
MSERAPLFGRFPDFAHMFFCYGKHADGSEFGAFLKLYWQK